jgi:hypothetical protein
MNSLVGRLALVALLGICVAGPSDSRGELATFGSGSYTIDEVFGFNYVQASDVLTLNTPFSTGSYIGGNFGAPYDWSAVPGFALQLRAPANPIIGTLGVFFLDELSGLIAGYAASTDGVGTTQTNVQLEIAEFGTMDFSGVANIGFNWSSASVSSSGDSLVIEALVVPEPATWSLLGLACLGWAAWRWRRMSSRR